MSDKPPVILVAEDDKSVRLVVQQALARQGYVVQCSGNAGLGATPQQNAAAPTSSSNPPAANPGAPGRPSWAQ